MHLQWKSVTMKKEDIRKYLVSSATFTRYICIQINDKED